MTPQALTMAWTTPAGASAVESQWRDLRAAGAPEGETPGRALALNLICRARDAQDAAHMAQTLWDLGPRHPARVFLVVPGEQKVQLRTAAARHGAEMVEIVVAPQRALSVVVPLLAADLPVVLLWRNGDPAAHPEFQQWAALADRVLVDAHRMHLSAEQLAAARALVPARCGFNDLTWTRLTPFRQLLCQGMDGVPGLALAIERVTLAGGCNLAARLFVGWMAHKLHWAPGQVELAFDQGERHEGLLRRLAVSGAAGSVVIEHHGPHVTMTAACANGAVGHWAGCAGAATSADRELLRGERDTLCEELSIGGADHLFLASLERGLTLL